MYLLPCRWQKALLALQKVREKQNISPGLPSSLALRNFHLAVSAGFSHRKWEQITFRKKIWKSVEICNETDGQRKSTADHHQSFFFLLFAAVQINPRAGPGGAVTTRRRSMSWSRLPLAGTATREGLELNIWEAVEVPTVPRIEASRVSALDGV